MRFIAIIIFFIGLLNTSVITAQTRVKKRTPTKIHFRPGGEEVVHRYVPPAYKWSNKKSGDIQFNVTYSSAILPAAQEAFENGVLKIIGDFFDSPVTINITLNWLQLDGNALAGASPSAYYSRFANVPNPNEVYPVALAEKIARVELNPSDEPDLEITVNSQIDWYYNFESPGGIGNKFDFVSIVLHEVFHGLGFLSLTGVTNDNEGLVRIFNDDRYYIYNEFVKDGSGVDLLSLEEGSLLLGSALTGGDLFYNLISRDEALQLFVPETWQPGSSMSHLDETFFNNTPSSLMTPSSNPGEVELAPGVAADMMWDMGWDFTYLLHTPTSGSEELDQDFTVAVEVISDSNLEDESLKLIYSADGFQADATESPLVLNQSTGLHEAVIPAPNSDVEYTYYLKAVNNRNVTFTNPGQAPIFFFSHKYAIDNIAPDITHRSQRTINNVDPSVSIIATITDEFIGIEEAHVEWQFNGVAQPNVSMTRLVDFSNNVIDDYEAVLEFPNGAPIETDIVEYKIIVVDGSKAKNSAFVPKSGNLFKLTVVPVAETAEMYVNEFNVTSDDFEGNGFSISKPQGFVDDAIHSTHPYPEEGGSGFLNLIYELSIPIKIVATNGIMKFDEIVIVEPGEPGTRFGQQEFWDYCIVEGKKAGSSEWLPFLDGYDSRANNLWLSAYNNGQNGTPAMFVNRTIDMLSSGNFEADDEVFIRFRLFSDPLTFGWGWAIDNLLIQDLSTPVSDFVLEENFTLIPNPVSEKLTVSLNLESASDHLSISIVDVAGKIVLRDDIDKPKSAIRKEYKVSDLESGVYFVNVTFNNQETISKKLVISH